MGKKRHDKLREPSPKPGTDVSTPPGRDTSPRAPVDMSREVLDDPSPLEAADESAEARNDTTVTGAALEPVTSRFTGSRNEDLVEETAKGSLAGESDGSVPTSGGVTASSPPAAMPRMMEAEPVAALNELPYAEPPPKFNLEVFHEPPAELTAPRAALQGTYTEDGFDQLVVAMNGLAACRSLAELRKHIEREPIVLDFILDNGGMLPLFSDKYPPTIQNFQLQLRSFDDFVDVLYTRLPDGTWKTQAVCR